MAARVPWLGPYLVVFNGTAKRDYALVNAAYDQLLRDYPKNTEVRGWVGWCYCCYS